MHALGDLSVYQKQLTGKQGLSTNLPNSVFQGHEVEACQTEHLQFFLPVSNKIKIDQILKRSTTLEKRQLE